MKIMTTCFKRSHVCTTTLNASDPAAGNCNPTPPPETPGQSHVSLGQSLGVSLLLSPGSWCAQSFVCALQESVSQSCVSSGTTIVGKWQAPPRGLMPYPSLLYPEPLPLQQTWIWHKPSWRRSRLIPHRAARTYTGLGNRLLEGTNRTLCAPGPRRKEQ